MVHTPPPSAGRREEPVDYRALQQYYDNEAAALFRQPGAGRRDDLRDDLIATLDAGSRVIDVGAGPARDGQPFVDAGCRYVGLDLAHGNALLAAASGLVVVQASLFHLPIATDSSDVVWTMSTLLHVADHAFDDAMGEIVRVVRPGGVLAVGLWGGVDREWVNETDNFDPPRFVSQRSHGRLRSMLERFGEIERFETWEAHTEWDYQFVVVRI